MSFLPLSLWAFYHWVYELLTTESMSFLPLRLWASYHWVYELFITESLSFLPLSLWASYHWVYELLTTESMRWSSSKSIPPPSVTSSSSAVAVPSDVLHVWLWGRGTCRVTSYSWSSRCSLSCSFKTDSCVCSLCLWRHHRTATHALKTETSLVLLRRHSTSIYKADWIFDF